MNRRNFFRSMIGGIAATAAVRTFPFRVFSFPSQIVLGNQFLTIEQVSLEALRILEDKLEVSSYFAHLKWQKQFPVGTTVRVRIPQRIVRPGELGTLYGFDYCDPKNVSVRVV